MKKWLGITAAALALTFAFAPAAMAKSVVVYGPYTSHYYYDKGDTVKIWGYTTPKFKTAKDKSLKLYISRRNSSGDYYRYAVKAAKYYRSSSYSSSTRYKKSVDFNRAGHYRVHARLRWTDYKGKTHTRWSGWRYIRVTS